LPTIVIKEAKLYYPNQWKEIN